MGWLSRRRKDRPGTLRTAEPADLEHLREFARSRSGVEAYLEPRTNVTDTTLVLVASTGEWTRRRVDGPSGARAFAKKLDVELFEIGGAVGYPQRMRDWRGEHSAPEQA